MRTNDATRATAEAMPTINRRRMLLGLAAASTAAATINAEASAAPAENPMLLELIEQLPAVAAKFHEADDAYRAMETKWYNATPWAPDELSAPGTAWPYDDPKQPGRPEVKALGGYLWRKGDDFPRRIVVDAWKVRAQISDVRREKRRAKKAGALADFLAYEEEEKRLKKLYDTAAKYEDEFCRVRAGAHADYERLSPPRCAAKDALEDHIAAIMDEPDFTMEGLVVKAQALAEWDRIGDGKMDKFTVRHGLNWHGQIAASILRYANGGAK